MQKLFGQLPTQVDRLILDVDGVLVDPSSSYYWVGEQLLAREGGALPEEDIGAFKWAGGFNDDWELARAALGVHRYRRSSGDTRPLAVLLQENPGLPGMLRLVGKDDPGDLAPECEALYAQIAHEERPLLQAPLLQEVASRLPLYACTGRTLPQTLAVFAAFGLSPRAFTSCETARKPSPEALLPLLEGSRHALFVGDTWDDCLTCLNTQPLTPTRLHFFWCLPPSLSPASASLAAQQRLGRGGEGVCVGVEPLLLYLLSLFPSP